MRARWFYLASAALLTVWLAACGGKKEETQPAPAAPAAAPVDTANAGELNGKVTLDGAAPKVAVIKMNAEPFCLSQHKEPVYSQDVVVDSGNTLENVIVYVKQGQSGSFQAPSQPAQINQKGCMYDPHVVGMMAGQQLQVINSDNTSHNIHPLPKDNREWNESQTPGASPIIKEFARPESAFPVKCNIHPWMKAYIAVFNHPYFSVTGKDGSYTIKNLPPGTYTIEAWQEKLGTTTQQVTIGAKETKTVNFTFKAAAGD